MNWELGVKVPSGEDCILSNVQWINKKELLSHEIYKSNLQPLMSHYNHNPSYQEGISVAVFSLKFTTISNYDISYVLDYLIDS